MRSKKEYSYDTFLSPFTWRYAGDEMKAIWSEENKRLLLRKVWCALAKAENHFGLISDEELSDIEKHCNDVDIQRSLEIESEIHHDLMAEIKAYAEQCPIGGGKIHLGATSTDILDNAEALRLKEAVKIIKTHLKTVSLSIRSLIKKYGNVPCMAYTHLQSAEETILGHRFLVWKESIDEAYNKISSLKIKGKGFKGAVGNYSGYDILLRGVKKNGSLLNGVSLEKIALKELSLEAFNITTQVYPRYQDMEIMSALSLVAAVSSKIAFDIRLLQSSAYNELSEPFSKHQVGSSAMPFKRNPINSEKINSLARFVHSLESSAFENTASSALERTLDDSANRRLFLPEAFLGVDEILITLKKVLMGLVIKTEGINHNREKYGVFAATEGLLMKAVEKGGDRQFLHEDIRKECIVAKQILDKTGNNPLKENLSNNKEFLRFMTKDEILCILNETPRFESLELKLKEALKNDE